MPSTINELLALLDHHVLAHAHFEGIQMGHESSCSNDETNLRIIGLMVV